MLFQKIYLLTIEKDFKLKIESFCEIKDIIKIKMFFVAAPVICLIIKFRFHREKPIARILLK